MTDRNPPEGEGYDLQAVYAEKTKPFWFRWADQWWNLPHMAMLDFEVQDRIERFSVEGMADDDVEAAKAKVNELFDMVMGAEQGKRWREVTRPMPMLLDMLNRWSEHSGATPGEDSASGGSSKSTVRPSKRTSTGGTGSASPRRSRAKKAGQPANS